ncbi:MAG: FKBP-type peptidyl-prolyl cis-trans isomerase [Arenicella sp.]
MIIEKDSVVAIAYTLKNTQGEVLDASEEGKPLNYLHGAKNIIVGLEQALEGKKEGDNVSVDIESELAYGPRIDALTQQVPKESFGEINTIEMGMRFQAETEQGPVSVVVTEIEGDLITVDGNHPLAGQDLHFDVTIESVREASTEEKEHGHVHGPGGHHH